MYTFVYPELNIKVKVENQKQLQKFIHQIQLDFDLGGRDWDWNGAKLYKGKELLGRVAYNSNVFDKNENRVEL